MLPNLSSFGFAHPGLEIFGVNVRVEYLFGLATFSVLLVILLVLLLNSRTLNRSADVDQLSVIKLPDMAPGEFLMESAARESSRELVLPSDAMRYSGRIIDEDRERVLRMFRQRKNW